MKTILTLLLLAGTTSLAFGLDAGNQSVDKVRPLRLRDSTKIVYPQTLINDGITEGRARVVINVDETGVPTEWLAVEYTRREFAEAVVRSIQEWRFDPMIVESIAVPSQTVIGVNFSAKGVVVNLDVFSSFNRLVPALANRPAYAPCTLRELDGIPVPVSAPAPGYSKELHDHGVTGSAVVEFYIDENGDVRMPALVWADFNELGNLATAAVRDWKFDPPMSNGRPVMAHARQRFVFGSQ